MIGRLISGERYHCVLIYTKINKINQYETLMLTDKDIERFRSRASKNIEYELDRPKPLWFVLKEWIISFIRRK